MNNTIYRSIDHFGSTRFTCESWVSMEDAKLDNYTRAYKSGYWSPPKLREKPWQFWRPAHHGEWVLKVLAAAKQASE